MSGVLLDTSAWIDFFRPGGGAMAAQVTALIESDRALLCGVVVAELLQGAKGKREATQITYMIERLPRIPTREEDWEEAGLVLGALRRRGITVPVTDALIAVIAKRCDVEILTADQHFRHLPVILH